MKTKTEGGQVGKWAREKHNAARMVLFVDELIDPATLPERCLLFRQIKEAMVRRQDFPAAAWFRDLQRAYEELSGRKSFSMAKTHKRKHL